MNFRPRSRQKYFRERISPSEAFRGFGRACLLPFNALFALERGKLLNIGSAE